MPLDPELRALLTLHLVPNLGPRLTKALLERFGSAAAVLRAAPGELCSVPHIGEKIAGAFSGAMARASPDAEEELIDRHGVRLLARGHPGYPAPLDTLPDPPPLLYVQGALEAGDRNAVAVVGSRQCTTYGRRVAERLAAGLARKGFTVVSGLARGIDGAAHRGALQAGGRTVAVLAGGLSRIYPPEHDELAREVEARGALLSEAPMTMEPMAGMFPARNRIISGLSRAVVIVEAAERSGALITARHAAEQGRPVFAVPGPVDSAASAGALKLLRDGATLVRDADDILEDLDGVAPGRPSPAAPSPAGLDEIQQKIWDFLASRPRHVDELARHLNLAVPQLTGALMTLEMKKVIRRLQGNQYERR